MCEEVQQLLIKVYEQVPGVPTTGGIVSDGGLTSSITLALILMFIVMAVVTALTWKKSRFSRIILAPVLALALIAVPLTSNASALEMTPFDETLILEITRPDTEASGVVDLSELFGERNPYYLVDTYIRNLSEPSIEIVLDLDEPAETLLVEATVPATVEAGEYEAEIVFDYGYSCLPS